MTLLHKAESLYGGSRAAARALGVDYSTWKRWKRAGDVPEGIKREGVRAHLMQRDMRVWFDYGVSRGWIAVSDA